MYIPRAELYIMIRILHLFPVNRNKLRKAETFRKQSEQM